MPRSKPPRKKPRQESQQPKKLAATYPSISLSIRERWKLHLTKTGRIVLSALGIALGVLGTPLIFGVSVQNPIPALPGKPFSTPFEITNQNLMPFMQVQYSCNINEA